jgi:hypothetical protein
VVHALVTQVRRPATETYVADLPWRTQRVADRMEWFRRFPAATAVPDNWNEMDETDRRAWLDDFKSMRWNPERLDLLVKLRNSAAHPVAGTTLMPGQAADSLGAAADFINALWPEPPST